MALSLGGGRRRWSCRAARREKGGAACRHFHVHYHIRCQVWPFLPLRLPPLFLLLPYLLTIPVLLFAVLAFLVCFGWFTLVYLVSSLWSRSMGCASDAHEPGGSGSDEEEERVVWPVTEHAGDSSSSGVCVEGREIKEVFEGGLPEESRYISRIASTGICIDCDVATDGDKIVKEVFERASTAIPELDGSKEKDQLVMDIPNHFFLEELDTKEFSTSLITTELFDVLSIGQEFGENKKEMSVLSSLEILEFIDKHDAAEVVVNGAGTDFVIHEVTSSGDSASHGLGDENKKVIKQEQSIPELSVNIGDKRLPEDVIDEWQGEQNLASEHNNKQPEATSNEEYGNQIVGLSDEAHVSTGEMAGLPLDSVRENISEKTLFDQSNSAKDSELQEDLIRKERVESSTSASTVCDFADNHWRILEELDGFANEENIQEEASPGTSILGTVEDEEEDNNCATIGAPRRLALVQRSPAPWWNLCGVLDVFAGDED